MKNCITVLSSILCLQHIQLCIVRVSMIIIHRSIKVTTDLHTYRSLAINNSTLLQTFRSYIGGIQIVILQTYRLYIAQYIIYISFRLYMLYIQTYRQVSGQNPVHQYGHLGLGNRPGQVQALRQGANNFQHTESKN